MQVNIFKRLSFSFWLKKIVHCFVTAILEKHEQVNTVKTLTFYIKNNLKYYICKFLFEPELKTLIEALKA